MLNSLDSSNQSSYRSSQIFPSIDSYNGKFMLVAVVSLLIVISFVLLLHVYAKWFLGRAHHRRRRSVSISHELGPTWLHHNIHTLSYDESYMGFSMDGLDALIIASLPLFVYKFDEYKTQLECVICLSLFEDDDIGRHLPKCHHAFHVECIDMWLHSHSNCPICRAPVRSDKLSRVSSLSISVVSEEGSRDSPETISGESPTPSPPPPPPSSSSSSHPPSSLGCSLKRMLSMSRSEHKVFPSSSVTELNV